jgi:diaminopimelate decarboxylase
MDLENNEYKIQGNKVTDLAKRFGTPVYIYDTQAILGNYKKLKSAFSDVDLRIKYAAKALTNINILKLLKNAGSGLDVVSPEEAQIGIKAGYDPGQILFTGNSINFNEVEQAVELGVLINIDNISILEQFGHKYGHKIPVCLRLNPHIMAGGNTKISTGHVDSKFGISIYQLPHILRVVKSYNINVVGLHMHTGSDILDSDVFLQIADILFGIAHDFNELQFIDLGSGFKVAYKEGDITTDIFDLGLKLSKAFRQFCMDYGRDLELWLEPGKFLVSESGILLVRTNVVKTTPATVFAGVDSGMNHLLRPMMYDAYHEIVNISNPKGIKRIYTVVGNICETDTLGFDRKLPEIREGDLLAIKNAGAYGFSMASNYNSRVRPAEVMVHEGKAFLIRQRESMEDILRNQIIIEF